MMYLNHREKNGDNKFRRGTEIMNSDWERSRIYARLSV